MGNESFVRNACPWFMVIVICSWPLPTQASDLSPNDLLSAYTESLKAFERAAFTYETKVSYTGFAMPHGTVMQQSNHKVWRDGNRWKFIQEDTGRLPDRGKLVSTSNLAEEVYPEKGFIHADFDPANKNLLALVARLDELPESMRLGIGGNYGPIVTGHLSWNDGVILPDILQESTLTVRKDIAPKSDLMILQGTGKWGEHTLWLDPTHNYIPRRIEQRKKGQDWIDRDKPLSEVGPGDGRVYPKASYKEVSQRFEATKVDQIAGKDIITEVVLTEQLQFANNQSVTLTTQMRISNLAMSPDYSSGNPFVINTPIPNGTPVEVYDSPGIEYEWQDGKIVKKVSAPAVAFLGGMRFLVGSWLGRGILLLSALALVLILIALRQRWRKGKGNPP